MKINEIYILLHFVNRKNSTTCRFSSKNKCAYVQENSPKPFSARFSSRCSPILITLSRIFTDAPANAELHWDVMNVADFIWKIIIVETRIYKKVVNAIHSFSQHSQAWDREKDRHIGQMARHVRELALVHREASHGESAEASSVQVDGQRVVRSDQAIQAKVELLPADYQRILHIP